MDTRSENNPDREVSITVRCMFFAQYAEFLGRTELELTLPAGSTVSHLVERVRADAPGGSQLPERPLVASNKRHVKPDCAIEDGDELAFLPPLGGG